MAEKSSASIRSDLDIEAGIQKVMQDSYPPLMHDRHRIDVELQNGQVTISGYVKVPHTASYLVNKVQQVEGVKSVDTEGFYNDEDIRLRVGRVVPPGVQIIVEYGAVILAGKLPDGANVDEVVGAVRALPGVHRVLTSLAA